MKPAVRTFLLVAGVAGLVTFGGVYAVRPVPMLKPACADSLAGVVTRLAGGDSALVGTIRWQQSPEKVLDWVTGEEYAYRGPQGDLVPIAAVTAFAPLRVTFAKGTLPCPDVVKHELVHAVGHVLGHPAGVFQPVERYRGR
jgi:hypothetical protein